MYVCTEFSISYPTCKKYLGYETKSKWFWDCIVLKIMIRQDKVLDCCNLSWMIRPNILLPMYRINSMTIHFK